MSSTQILTSINMLGQTVTDHNAAKLILLRTILCHTVYQCNEIFEFPRLDFYLNQCNYTKNQ